MPISHIALCLGNAGLKFNTAFTDLGIKVESLLKL